MPADGNVVPLRASTETPDDIVRDVQNRAAETERAILNQLNDLLATAQAQHRRRAQALLPIGYAMTRPALEQWLEIGQRMLGQRGNRA